MSERHEPQPEDLRSCQLLKTSGGGSRDTGTLGERERERERVSGSLELGGSDWTVFIHTAEECVCVEQN